MAPAAKAPVDRRTFDLSGCPDLVAIYLGTRVNALVGIKTLFGSGPKIATAFGQQPGGLLLHENFVFSLLPPHRGFRQYWRDFESLEHWARCEPHRAWWLQFLRDSGGTGFWHDTYFLARGVEAVYADMTQDIGFLRFAPVQPARGAMFSARGRARRAGKANEPAALAEDDPYR